MIICVPRYSLPARLLEGLLLYIPHSTSAKLAGGGKRADRGSSTQQGAPSSDLGGAETLLVCPLSRLQLQAMPGYPAYDTLVR